MKKIIFICIILISYNSFSQKIDIGKDYYENLKGSRIPTQQEDSDFQLLSDLYNSVDRLQQIRKYHYENRYNNQYNKKYSKRVVLGLSEPNSWFKEEKNITISLNETIALYNEQYQRCKSKYYWTHQFPSRIWDKLDIDNLENY